MTFDDLILVIVHDHSGGIKMTELVSEIVARCCELSKSGTPIAEINPMHAFLDALDHKLKEMQESGELCLLNYACPLGDDLVREKTFVYLRLDVGPLATHSSGRTA